MYEQCAQHRPMQHAKDSSTTEPGRNKDNASEVLNTLSRIKIYKCTISKYIHNKLLIACWASPYLHCPGPTGAEQQLKGLVLDLVVHGPLAAHELVVPDGINLAGSGVP